ncbi:hypothetical protein [Pseudonocardia alaniniphila]|uniref:Uncharacterized protein n=1 Tax=Pseudonocardia alaniniphila TaxID=75291 RepID=A0ABS9TKF4_9PSEU|nr:hypothetical protein [Pseudonocardia alaniniphila]MCH6168883.1 hypothetical protein [Pseudonocardia alaniniphila]
MRTRSARGKDVACGAVTGPQPPINDIVGDPLVVWGRGSERAKVVPEVLEAPGLDPAQVADRAEVGPNQPVDHDHQLGTRSPL